MYVGFGRYFPILQRKDTTFRKKQMKRMMHKKEYLLQTRNLQQIFYQTNDFVIFGYFLSYFLFFSSPVRWAFRRKSPYSTW